MFDGSFQSRREINLSGTSSSRRRRRGGTAKSTAASSSSLLRAPAAANGIIDRKSELLESARQQREQRAAIKRRNDGAKTIQRRWRGYKDRKGVAVELAGRQEELMRRGLMGEEKGAAEEEDEARRTTGLQSGDSAAAASILAFRLSPPLRPFFHLGGSSDRAPPPSSSSMSNTAGGGDKQHGGGRASRAKVVATDKADADGAVLDALLSFASIVVVGSGDGGRRTPSSASSSTPEEERARTRHVARRICSGSLASVQSSLLLVQKRKQQQRGRKAGDEEDEKWGIESSRRLVQLVETLLERDDDDAPSKVLGLGGSDLLLSTFRQWWFFDDRGEEDKEGRRQAVSNALLRLSCRTASGLASSSPGRDDGLRDAALSILASAVVCRSRRTSVEEDSDDEVIMSCHRYFVDPSGRLTNVDGDSDGASSWKVGLLSSLASTLLRLRGHDEKVHAVSSTSAVSVLQSAVHDTVRNRECLLLSNAFEMLLPFNDGVGGGGASTSKNGGGTVEAVEASSAMAKLLRYALEKRSDLTDLSSLAAAGEDVTAGLETSAGGRPTIEEGVVDLTQVDDDDDDEDEDEDEEEDDGVEEEEEEGDARPTATGAASAADNGPSRATASSRRYKRINSGQKYSRSDLQTLPKLDRLYKTELQRVRREALLALRKGEDGSTCDLANLSARIGGGDLMLRIGASLFGRELTSSLDRCDQRGVSSGLSAAREAYASVLSTILRFCTGIRLGGASPLLSKLAFHAGVLEGLWRHVQSKPAASSAPADDDGSTASFCDLFAHHLLAVDDEEFLHRYGGRAVGIVDPRSAPVATTGDSPIQAVDVILRLRSALYELYWSRPVVASDVTVPAASADPDVIGKSHRARMLLSGTKLFNALYERWCRLLRSAPFCDEQCWWFPRLVTRERDDEGAVLGRQVTTFEGDDESMDEDSAASPMDVDDDGSSDEESEGGAAAARAPTSAADAENDALATSFRDPKMARVLTSVPQALPFDRRVNLFHSLLNADKLRTQDETAAFRQMMMNIRNDEMEGDFTGRERVTIRRDQLYSDSMEQLNRLGRKLRRKVQVTFINRHGATEAGIDGGGVFKEFLDDLIKEAFNPREEDEGGGAFRGSIPLFAVSPLQTLYVNVACSNDTDTLQHFEFLGRVLGKAVYESILVEPQFCLPFLNKLLVKQNTMDDLKNLDPEYYKHLSVLRNMNEKEIQDLGLTFELTLGKQTSNGASRPRTVELVPGGSVIPVTKQNVIRYVHLVAHQRMNVSGSRQTHAFLRGFRDLIPAAWVRLFSSYELQKVISGDDTVKGIDVKGMKAVMQYSGGYHPSQPIMQWFWDVVENMTPSQQRMFLKFMTSCSRQPLLGFNALVPLPCVQQVHLREDGRFHRNALSSGEVRLPTSSTCMNLLKLPNYPSKEMLREKLLYAIESAAGFELS